jgi:PadR family transcriptional regulator, regulatory protein PadR
MIVHLGTRGSAEASVTATGKADLYPRAPDCTNIYVKCTYKRYTLSEHKGRDMSAEKSERRVEVRPRNWLVAVTLLMLREKNSYGYELMERTAAFGFEAMNPGAMYRALRHMEKEGLVESTWKTSKSGPARRIYSITDAGEAYLNFWAEALKQYQQATDDFIRIHQGSAATNGRGSRTTSRESSRGRGL